MMIAKNQWLMGDKGCLWVDKVRLYITPTDPHDQRRSAKNAIR